MAPAPSPVLGQIFGVQGLEIIILAVVIIILLIKGPEHIPQLARALGKARGEFEKGKQEFETELGKGEDRAKLEEAARGLGIDPSGKSDDELRRAIRDAVSDDGDDGDGDEDA